MAATVLRHFLAARGTAGSVVVDSAGTSVWHASEGMSPAALAALAARGYDGTGHVARQFDPSWLDERDLLVALDRTHMRILMREAGLAARRRIVLLRMFDPAAGRALDVPDPYGGSPAEFEWCLEMIEPACEGLSAFVSDRLPRPEPPPGAGGRRSR